MIIIGLEYTWYSIKVGKIYPWVYGYGYTGNVPVSANPMGMIFFALTNSWVSIVTQAPALMD
jgi:hypothetical protein